METLATHACFGGTQSFHRHASASCAGPMRFGVYVPPLMEELGLCELEHNAKNNRVRAK